ncbi:MAG: hypothetical protein EBS74_04395 [Flavobacteriia bacterium]|nr:hypothetical protein [Flavobacteriia bacterium]
MAGQGVFFDQISHSQQRFLSVKRLVHLGSCRFGNGSKSFMLFGKIADGRQAFQAFFGTGTGIE